MGHVIIGLLVGNDLEDKEPHTCESTAGWLLDKAWWEQSFVFQILLRRRIYIYMYIYVYVCMHACMYVCIYMCVCVCV